MQLLDQIVIALEQKVDGEFLQQIGDVVIRWRVLYQTLHIDAAREAIEEGLEATVSGLGLFHITYRLLLLRFTSFLRRSSFLSCGDIKVRCLLRGFVLHGGF